MNVSFPTEEDFKRLGRSFPYDNLKLSLGDITQHSSDNSSFVRAMMAGDIITWVNSYNVRIHHANRSNVFMSYYFEQGIPEDIDPIHFDNATHNIKDYFDYFADHFFYNIFSAWDTIGHLLNVTLDLNIKKPSFESALEQVKKRNKGLYLSYEPIITDERYSKAKQARNNITHNVPYGVNDNRAVQVSPTRIYFGTNIVTTSGEIFRTARSALPLLEQTISVLKTQSHRLK